MIAESFKSKPWQSDSLRTELPVRTHWPDLITAFLPAENPVCPPGIGQRIETPLSWFSSGVTRGISPTMQTPTDPLLGRQKHSYFRTVVLPFTFTQSDTAAFPLWLNSVPINSLRAFTTVSPQSTVAYMWLTPDREKPRHRTRRQRWISFLDSDSYLNSIVPPVLAGGTEFRPAIRVLYTSLPLRLIRVSNRSRNDHVMTMCVIWKLFYAHGRLWQTKGT